MSGNTVTRRSAIHGNGVFAAKPLAAGIEVMEYTGRLRTHAYIDKVYSDTVESGHTFLFTLNERYVVDGNFDSNDARWINHSCEPNCKPYVIEDPGKNPKLDRIVIETLRDIGQGEELTFDYGIRLDCRQTARLKKIWACRCGAPTCTGTMLKPKR
ncbi:SET domain-containing protein [Nevskia ramosa]|uniref:SET domain-containing protein n=1 Tax=Nevskia ramosa TaxID=64002 RepID=UPI002354F207|nr:SET domain-containing protein-lysine N-methyltransferase [Nevskia ramosa]